MSGRPRKPISSSSATADRFVPDLSKLFDLPSTSVSKGEMSAPPTNGAGVGHAPNYENTDLHEITRRQLNEDITAYRYDVNYCNDQLACPDLTPQETRTLQLRILDLGHQTRHCQHRLEQMDAEASNAPHASRSNPAGVKRRRISKGKVEGDSDENEGDTVVVMDDGDSELPEYSGENAIQRLGFWKCHLCTSDKYLSAGSSRVPSAPCKWPLKDISKMLNHFLDMHIEQEPKDRCMELGDALNSNRGPFKYWLTRTRSQNLGDGSMVDDIINSLKEGQVPHRLRSLNKAAAVFPNRGPADRDAS